MLTVVTQSALAKQYEFASRGWMDIKLTQKEQDAWNWTGIKAGGKILSLGYSSYCIYNLDTGMELRGTNIAAIDADLGICKEYANEYQLDQCCGIGGSAKEGKSYYFVRRNLRIEFSECLLPDGFPNPVIIRGLDMDSVSSAGWPIGLNASGRFWSWFGRVVRMRTWRRLC